jgi:hypothetical protein
LTLDKDAYEWLKDIVDQLIDTVKQSPNQYNFSLDPILSLKKSMDNPSVRKYKKSDNQKPVIKSQKTNSISKTNNISNKNKYQIETILKHKKPFTINQMAEKLNISAMQTRNLITSLLADKKIKELGYQPNSGRGRSPMLYQSNQK